MLTISQKSLALTWMPHVNGVFPEDEPHYFIDQDKIVHVHVLNRIWTLIKSVTMGDR